MPRCKPTNNSILTLNQWRREGTLRIPDVQRSLVWTTDQKRLLIDSLIREYDVPKIYLMQVWEDGIVHFDVYDGQQRLDTMYTFFENQYALGNEDPIVIEGQKIEIANRTYADLDNRIKMRLQQTNLSCVILEDFSQEQAEDMFLRLQHGTPLNAAEKRRAINGTMRDVVRKFADHEIFSKTDFINYSDSRYAFEDSVSKVLHQFIHQNHVGISPGVIKKTYEANPSITPNHKACVAFLSSANWIVKHFVEPPQLKKFSFITLFWVIRELRETYSLKGFEKEIAQAYNDFELERKTDGQKDIEDQDQTFISYRDYARSDSTPNMKDRAEILISFILGRVPKLAHLDPKRGFDDAQREVLFRRSKRVCQSCEDDIDKNSFHADHIIPHSLGGTTSIENGQALCASCNLAKGADSRTL